MAIGFGSAPFGLNTFIWQEQEYSEDRLLIKSVKLLFQDLGKPGGTAARTYISIQFIYLDKRTIQFYAVLRQIIRLVHQVH